MEFGAGPREILAINIVRWPVCLEGRLVDEVNLTENSSCEWSKLPEERVSSGVPSPVKFSGNHI